MHKVTKRSVDRTQQLAGSRCYWACACIRVGNSLIVAEITALPLTDFKLTQLQQVIQTGWPKVKKSLSGEIQHCFLLQDELGVECPLRFFGLVVPWSIHERIVCLAHKGHWGVVHTKNALGSCIGGLPWMLRFIHSCLIMSNLSLMTKLLNPILLLCRQSDDTLHWIQLVHLNVGPLDMVLHLLIISVIGCRWHLLLQQQL